jgi:hypothetical protein
MTRLSNFIKTDSGKIVISIIMGFGFAALFRASCKGKNCVVYKGAPQEDLDKIYTFNSKCYQFEPQHVKCNTKKQIISF